MANIDISTDVGKVRLKIGDTSDLPFLADSAITATINEFQGNLQKASSQCAMYILAQLSFQTHRKLSQIEIFGKEAFDSYKQFLSMLVKDPYFAGKCPLPYANQSDDTSPLIEFVEDWNANYVGRTQSEVMHIQATRNFDESI